ncbi:ComEA family DNA-binding protein [Streptomyces sp. NBC_01020]|uniref:helix-hairpin-helix domain-containing protein n=1 Tax=Streptomyces sp. NBC_01020 TaxID=2903722 RepID=UPI003870C5DB|nr:ComEA family DNA-binding protein [Streptomyces sp. NBC_01020]
MTSRTLTSRSATSGPGRAPASDGRTRHTGSRRRIRLRYARSVPDAALRLRADALLPARSAASVAPVDVTARSSRPVAADQVGEAGRPGGGVPGGDERDRGVPGGGVPGGDVPDRGVLGDGVPNGDVPLGGAPGGGAPAPGRMGAAVARVGEALRERLPLWVQARCGLTPRTLAALAVVLVVAAALAAQHFWAGRPRSVPAPAVVSAGLPAAGPRPAGEQPPSGPHPSPEPPPSGPLPPGTGPTHPGAAAARIVVDVSGKVRRPGIQRLPAGSRVTDALRAAGGVKDGTDTSGLNQARVLTDGEQVVVGGPPVPSDTAAGGTGSAAGGPGVPAASTTGPVSLSSATVEQLDTLPGVGPVLAQHIIDYRTEHGGFTSVDELRQVTGIGDRRYSDLQPLVRP